MRLQYFLGAAAVCTLYLGAATHPIKNSKALYSRGRFGGDDPEPSVPGRGDPAIPAAGAGAGTGATNWGQALDFQPPASFTKDIGNGKGSFLSTGQGVEADLKAAKDPDASVAAVNDYATNIKNYEVADGETMVLFTSNYYENLETPLNSLGIDGNTEFRDVSITAREDEPIHQGFYSHSQKTAIMADLDNSKYGPTFTGNKVYQSQILFEEWSKEAGGDSQSLQWVVRSDISNGDTQAIISDAQTATKGSVQSNTQVTFSATAAEGSAEKASFDALAGSDNGRMVFKMLTDNHQAMGGKTIVAAHTWIIAAAPAPWYHLVWELST